MNLKPIIKPILNNLPFLYGTFGLGTGGTDNARYCYSVWLRHLVKAKENGLHEVPRVVAELGPGDSLGVGMAAFLSGAEKYYALDAVKYANAERNEKIYGELVKLFAAKAAIPGDDEFPNVNPKLGDYGWREWIDNFGTDKKDLTPALSFARRGSTHGHGQLVPSPLEGEGQGEVSSMIKYVAPWDDPKLIKPNSVDFIIAQAVLEHVNDLVKTYETLYLWLKPGGFLSQDVDFKSHNFTWKWNGHWGVGDMLWKILAGRRKWVINRESLSKHLEIMQDTGFEVVVLDKTRRTDGIKRSQLAKRFAHLSEEDFETSQMYILARKPQKNF